jgi:hypothetical protein
MADDFSEAIKRILASRVGNLCSNPKCRALTSGPQVDPTKALNVGVAAHITAASPAGPRYDPNLSPEQRSGHENGIWLCQTDAKLIDNEPARYDVGLLREWKRGAEQEALDRIGRTAEPIVARTAGPSFDLQVGVKARITPIIPREHEQSEFMLVGNTDECFQFRKTDSDRYVDLPKSFVEKIHRYGNSRPALIQLSGRLQWVSARRNFELFPDKPPAGPGGAYGIGKDVDNAHPARLGVEGKFGREDRLPEILGRGWSIFYDADGMYLRWAGQVFVVAA